MVKWVVTNWMRYKQKFILMLIGALFISTGLCFLIGLSETSKGTILETLEKKWKASYDIVVRPQGSVASTEEKGLMDPNYLSGLSGGITFDELQAIREIEGVSIAAPISILGYTMITSHMGEFEFKDSGIYRLSSKFTEYDGITDYIQDIDSYYGVNLNLKEDSTESMRKYGFFTVDRYGRKLTKGSKIDLFGTFTILVAAIDPVAENQLVGLKQATIHQDNSRYFDKQDTVQTFSDNNFEFQVTQMPILLSATSPVDYTYTYELEKLDLKTDSTQDVNQTLQIIAENGAEDYLETVREDKIEQLTFDSGEAHRELIKQLLHNDSTEPLILDEKPSPLIYEVTTSPFPNRWNTAYEIVPPNITNDFYHAYRELNFFDKDISKSKSPRIHPNFIGVFDPRKLQISTDPVTDLPMETYRLPTASYVLDESTNPINPPRPIKATSNPFGYIMQPPFMLTTIDAAKEILGHAPISAIRIKVDGVDSLNEQSQLKLERIASEIRRKTGLRADITLGSSPQPLLIHIPDIKGQDSLGWMEQPWIKTGVSINIFQETKLGYTGIIFTLIVIAIIYVLSNNYISFLARKQEIALLMALGWKQSTIRKIFLVESLLLASLVSIITIPLLFYLSIKQSRTVSIDEIILIIVFIYLIYIIGAMWPSILISKISPMEVIKQGEINNKVNRFGKIRGMLGLVRKNLLGRFLRNLISILAIGLPSALLLLFIIVSSKLDGVLYTSWLGEYVAMEVGIPHYISIGISLFIAILTTGEVIWQNVLEREREIALFKAVGWKNWRVQCIVLLEGATIGLLAGIIGMLIGILLLSLMYTTTVINSVLQYTFVMLITVIIGMISALFPSIKASRIEPFQALKE
jgi:putative ABC transport system permease protein